VKRFNADDILPAGWVWGNLKQSGETRAKRSASLVGSYFAYSVDTKEIKRFKKDEILPDGWIKGRP
jgi:hypothetical protein